MDNPWPHQKQNIRYARSKKTELVELFDEQGRLAYTDFSPFVKNVSE